jgi:hypothetical protein
MVVRTAEFACLFWSFHFIIIYWCVSVLLLCGIISYRASRSIVGQKKKKNNVEWDIRREKEKQCGVGYT